MKKKSLTITLFVIVAVVALVLILFTVIADKGGIYMLNDEDPVHLSFNGDREYETGNDSNSNEDDVDSTQVTINTVQVLEEISETEESSYRVGATLPGTDFSSMGQILADEIEKEWSTYDSMTREQQLISSKLWGAVDVQTDTWDECEEAIGLTIYNPLETLDWLNKVGYFGMDSTDVSMPVKHVQAVANTAQTTDRKLSEINVTAGYNTENIRVTLTATLLANTREITTGSGCRGYATYEHNIVTTESGIPVLIVITNETNNTGYYNGDYFDPTAYWVKDNVFYTLRVFGDETDKVEIQATLARILAEI